MTVARARTRLISASLICGLIGGLALVSGEALATSSGGGDAGGLDLSSAWFISPLPNAYYEGGPVVIDAEIGVYNGIDDEPIATVELFVDGTSFGELVCDSGCLFPDIELARGAHELEVVSDTQYMNNTMVYVDVEPPPPPEPEPDPEEDGGPVGRGCSTGGDTAPLWSLLALPGLMLLVRRER